MTTPILHIRLNGETRPLPAGSTLATLLAELGLTGRRVAVEVNGDIIPRGRHAEHALQDADTIEIVHALGVGEHQRLRGTAAR